MEIVIVFIISFLLSIISIPVMIPVSRKIHLIDKPDKRLKTHLIPTPITGGIVLSLIFTVLFSYPPLSRGIHWSFIIGFYIIFILGIIDDYKRLSPVPKLIIESFLALLVIFSGNSMEVTIFPKVLNFALTFIWIVGIINAVNLLDIMDTLASTITLIISMTLLFINLSYGNIPNLFILSALSGFLIVFLNFNKSPAKTYLGDCGSLIIGFILAFISINTKYTSLNNVAFLTPLLIFGIPIYDTFFVSIVRIQKGKNPLHGSPDHLAIKMMEIISKKGFIVFVVALLQTVLSLFAFLSTVVSTLWALVIYFFVLIVLTRIGFYINSIKKE